jgi:tetratricopeptide (TPR) repeat protein
MGDDAYLTVPAGRDPLAHRAEQTARYGARTFDMMRSSWACTACGAEVPPPPPIVMPTAPYRSLAEAQGYVARAVDRALADGAEHDPCPRCGAASRLVHMDAYVHSAQLGSDLVLRHTPGQAPQLFTWSAANGLAPLVPTPDLDASIARDALLRTIGAAKDARNAALALQTIEEALARIGGDPDLLAFLPWVNGQRQLELSARVAEACVRARPEVAGGHYWRAQAIVERVGAGQAPRAAIDEAVPMLHEALRLQPDYPDASIALANVSRIRGKDDEAEGALRTLLARHPQHPEANYTLGLVLLPKSPAEALACFERGEKVAPTDPDYPRSRARALLALGRVPEAQAAIARAKQLAPNDPRVQEVEGLVLGQSPMAQTIRWIVLGTFAFVFLLIVAIVGWVGWTIVRG